MSLLIKIAGSSTGLSSAWPHLDSGALDLSTQALQRGTKKEKTVGTVDELLSAVKDNRIVSIVVGADLSGVPAFDLLPGQTLRSAAGQRFALTFVNGVDRIRLTSDNAILDLDPQVSSDKRAIWNDYSVSTLGRITLNSLRTSGRVQILATGKLRAGRVEVNGLAISVPNGLRVETAAALPTVTLTGSQLAEFSLSQPPKGTVLVTGAAGNVGRSAVFTAKEKAATVYAGVLARQRTEVEKIGADFVVALDNEEAVRNLKPLDAVADTANGRTAELLIGKVKAGGIFASVLGPPVNASALPNVTVKVMQVTPDAKMLVHWQKRCATASFPSRSGRNSPFVRKQSACRGRTGARREDSPSCLALGRCLKSRKAKVRKCRAVTFAVSILVQRFSP